MNSVTCKTHGTTVRQHRKVRKREPVALCPLHISRYVSDYFKNILQVYSYLETYFRLYSLPSPDRLWGPPSLLPNDPMGTRRFIPCSE
jgi:hypothetical protein